MLIDTGAIMNDVIAGLIVSALSWIGSMIIKAMAKKRQKKKPKSKRRGKRE